MKLLPWEGSEKKGFTLIELIITISILAVLVAILVVAINPAEQLARSRDAKRVVDLDALRSAINIYLATASSTASLDGSSSGNENVKCYGGSGTDTIWFNSSAASPATWQTNNIPLAFSASTTQTVGSTGWLPARVDLTPGGSPIGNLPLDPSGSSDATYYYAYACNATKKTFALGATLESTYLNSDLALSARDGGSSNAHYEVGSEPNLF